MPHLCSHRHPTCRFAAGALTLAASASAAVVLCAPATAVPVANPRVTARLTADTMFVVGQISPVLNYGSGPKLAYVDLHNPSAYLTLEVGSAFYAQEFNAAGEQIGTIPSSNIASGFSAVPPGGDELVQLQMTTPGVTSLTVPNPAGVNSGDLADRLTVVGTPTVTSSAPNAYLISGSVSNPFQVPQSGRITAEAFDEAGRLLDSTFGYTDSNAIPAGADGTFSVSYLVRAGLPAPASFRYYVNGTPVDASASHFAGYIPVSSAPVAGRPCYIKPKLQGSDTAGLSGQRLRLFARTPGSAPRLLASGVTGSDGTASIKVIIPPAVEVFIVFTGDGTHFGSSTGDLAYMVTPALGLSGPHQAVKATSKQVLTGSFPFYPGERAVLQELINKQWQKVNNGGAGSTFSLHLTAPGKRGTYSYRLQIDRNPLHNSATSEVFTLTVW